MICLLEIRSFAPVGIHSYGSLHLYDEDGIQYGDSVRLTYKLGHLQARAMNKCNGIDDESKGFHWEAGMECNAFFSPELAIQAALATWRAACPTATKLVLGERILAGFRVIKELA